MSTFAKLINQVRQITFYFCKKINIQSLIWPFKKKDGLNDIAYRSNN